MELMSAIYGEGSKDPYIAHLDLKVGHSVRVVKLSLPGVVNGLVGQQLIVDGLGQDDGDLTENQGQQYCGILLGEARRSS